jgi:hypothetical protein
VATRGSRLPDRQLPLFPEPELQETSGPGGVTLVCDDVLKWAERYEGEPPWADQTTWAIEQLFRYAPCR